MKRKNIVLAILIAVVAVVGAVTWAVSARKILLPGISHTGTSSDWSGQQPPSGFSYGEADPNQPVATREQVIARANKFYIDKLGKNNFKKYYERLPQRDAFSSLPESAFDFIGYLPKADQINGYDVTPFEDPSDAVEYVQVNRTNLKEVYGFAPDCVTDARQCDYKVTRQQASDIAQKRGLSGELIIRISNDKGRYFLEVISLKDQKAVHIDYSSGKVIGAVQDYKPVSID